MLDIKFVRENPDAVKENIKKKFQDAKLPLVDEVIEKDAKYRAAPEGSGGSEGRPQQAEQGQRPAVRPAEEVHRRGHRRPSCRHRSTPTTPPSRLTPTRWQSWRSQRRQAGCTHSGDHVHHPPDDRPQRAHRPGRHLQRGGSALRRACRAGFPHPVPHRDHGELRRHRYGRRRPRGRQRLLLPAGQHRPPARGCAGLCPRLHDRQGLHLLSSLPS